MSSQKIKSTTAAIDSSGRVDISNLDPSDVNIVVLTKLAVIEKQLESINTRLATKDDVRAISARVDKLEATVERNDDWIKARTVQLDEESHSLGAKLKNRVVEFLVVAIMLISIAGIVGGAMYYIADANTQDEIRALKELAP